MLEAHLKKRVSKDSCNLNIRRVEKERVEWAGRTLASPGLVGLSDMLLLVLDFAGEPINQRSRFKVR
jgi:hypothetical protein